MDTTTSTYGTGALDSSYDLRDFWFSPANHGEETFDFNIEKKIGKKITVKDQNGSSSCGGQAWSYYGEVLETIATGSYETRSARWIYAHTAVPGGGSRGKDNCDFVIKNGFVQEVHAPSYEGKKPPKEPFMLSVPKLSKDAIEDKEVSRALSYLKVPSDFYSVAAAIREHNGCILSVSGEDNSTWRTAYPKPPTKRMWGHWLYAGKLKVENGKKYIGVLNSWGTKTGEKGWQWIGEDYFDTGFIREGWVLAWDYKPAKHKILLIETIKGLTKLRDLLLLRKNV